MARHPAHTYRVVIPSYQRPHGVITKTVTTLLDGGVAPARITVFLHDNDPTLTTYQHVLTERGINHHVTAERGIINQRAAITRAYPPGTPIVSIDDDLTALHRAVDTKTLARITDLDRFFRYMFTETTGRDLHVWGVAPSLNAFFLNPNSFTEGLKFLIFALFGFFNRPGHPIHHNTVTTKDDYEFSLRAWWWDGAVLRADGVAPEADIYTGEGGCQAEGARTPTTAETAVTSLIHQWPGLVRRNTRRRSDYPEILLSTRKRHAGNPTTTPPPGPQRRSASS